TPSSSRGSTPRRLEVTPRCSTSPTTTNPSLPGACRPPAPALSCSTGRSPIPTVAREASSTLSTTPPGPRCIDNSFVSYSLCCPSRATFFTGRYAHNTGVLSNGGGNGGCDAFDDTQTLARWLKHPSAPTLFEYDTALVGKYLNL